MSLPKVLNEIKRDLDAIKAHLGIEDEGEVGAQGIKWIGQAQDASEPEPESPDEVAARLDYEAYSAAEIIERVSSLTPGERASLAEYERANKNRPTVVRELEGGKAA